jgi:hypothetical protein
LPDPWVNGLAFIHQDGQIGAPPEAEGSGTDAHNPVVGAGRWQRALVQEGAELVKERGFGRVDAECICIYCDSAGIKGKIFGNRDGQFHFWFVAYQSKNDKNELECFGCSGKVLINAAEFVKRASYPVLCKYVDHKCVIERK